MRRVLAIFLKEMEVFLYSPMMYVLWGLFLFLNSWAFLQIISVLNSPSGAVQIYPVEVFFGGTIFFWITFMVLIPLLTMRTISEEKRLGSLEMIFTTPISEWEFVLGKFLAVTFILTMFWASSLIYPLMISDQLKLYWPAVAVAFLGTILLNMALSAIGILTSSLTANQLVSGFLSFVAILVVFTIGVFADYSVGPIRKVLLYLSLIEQYNPFSSGVIDSRSLVYFISLTVFFLSLTVGLLEARRWKG